MAYMAKNSDKRLACSSVKFSNPLKSRISEIVNAILFTNT